MDEQEFSLEDILKEFGSQEDAPQPEAEPEAEPEAAPEAEPEEQPQTGVTDQTIRLDTIAFTRGAVHNAAPIDDEEEENRCIPSAPEQEAFEGDWKPEFDEPIAEYVPPQPILFHPRSRLRELKKKLIEGPEKQYYALLEKGLGKLQVAIFLSAIVVLICAVATVMYALGFVQDNRMRLLVFGQFLAMLVSALLGSFQLIDGVADLFKGKFSFNTLLVFTFAICCVDGVLCLRQLRVPCCAAFSLQVTMSLWSAYQRRNTQLRQLDTMRKATVLDSVVAAEDYYEGQTGFLRGEGEVDDFTQTVDQAPKPEKILNIYAVLALLASIAVGIVAGVMHSVSLGIQVTAVTLLAATPATIFITLSRPMAVLEKRLHAIGAVICGWQGVQGLRRKGVFPLTHEDLFPSGTINMNGVKFYTDREPDQIVAYAAALVEASDSGLAPLFAHLLESRNGRHYAVKNLHIYDNGGIGGEVCTESVLVGSLDFLRQMGVEVPQGLRVGHAVCVAVDGELCGLFAVTFQKDRAAAAGIGTLSGYRGLNPVLTSSDFVLTEAFIRTRFGVSTKRLIMPEHEVRRQLQQKKADPAARALALSTKEGLAPFAYGVTGARSVYASSIAGIVVHLVGGILGIGIMLLLAILGAQELLTPGNLFLYELVWMIPGLLITQWTKHI